MTRKILTLALMCITVVLFAPLAHGGGPSDIVTAWTDKPTYLAGQNGKLYVTYNNVRDSSVRIHNITVVFDDWHAYINKAWMGNLTYEPAANEKNITAHGIHVFEISFTVPSDGRARETSLNIEVYTNLTTPDEPSKRLTIYVGETPLYMEQVVTLFTVQVVLLIVCTIIIAATVFLSTHRPKVTPKAKEKGE